MVVNKVGEIHEEYRTFDMEILASSLPADQEPFIVSIQHLGSTLTFDFAKTYWNSRLNTEHERIVTSILKQAPRPSSFSEEEEERKEEDASFVLDLCAGVGPFSIPLTNPTSYQDLVFTHS